MLGVVDIFTIGGSVATAASVLTGLNAYKIQQRVEYFRSFRRDFSRFNRAFDDFDENLSPVNFFEAENKIYENLKSYRGDRNTKFIEFLNSKNTRAQINRAFLYYILESKLNQNSKMLIDQMSDVHFTHLRQFPVTCQLTSLIISTCKIQLHYIIGRVASEAADDALLDEVVRQFEASELDEVGALETIAALSCEMPGKMIDDPIQPILDNLSKILSSIESIHVNLTDKQLKTLSQSQKREPVAPIGLAAAYRPSGVVREIFESFRKLDIRDVSEVRDDCLRCATIVEQLYERFSAKKAA